MNAIGKSTLLTAAAALAAAVTHAQQAIPLRRVSAPTARTIETVGALLGLKQLPGGRLLVDDARRRRVMIFDSTLTSYSVVIDSASGSANAYGPRSAPLVPFLGDSMLFVDFASQSLLVIDPKGTVGRVTTPPKPSDLSYLSQGAAGVDARGRLVYRGYERLIPPQLSSNQTVFTSSSPDSAPLVRADFDARTVDTIARIKVSTSRSTSTRGVNGMTASMKQIVNPLQWADDWAIHSDGSVAIVRGRDYHIDWINPDGSNSASPKMPFDWRRLTDDDKKHLADSVQKYQDSISAAGLNYMTSTMSGPSGTTTTKIAIQTEVVPLGEIPDYYPPIRSGAMKADFDGNLWILPYTSAQAQGVGLVYDVVNRKGEVYQRVQLPEKRSLAGFGPGGVIYLMTGDLKDGFFLERVRLIIKGPTS